MSWSPSMNYWAKIGLSLLAVWAAAAGIVYWARASQPTAESVSAYLRSANLNAGGRAQKIHKLEDMLNRVSYEDRQRINRSGDLRRFFQSLTRDEQMAYLDATLPAGFKQMMESFNKMPPEDRKRFVERAVQNLKEHEGEQRPVGNMSDDQLGQRVIDQGLHSFYQDANADVKLDLAPLIEQIQKNLQAGGGGRR